MITSNDLRKGLVIRYNNSLYSIEDFLHVKPGKGPAFVRSKLRDLEKGGIIDKTFRGGEKLEEVRISKKSVQYSYNDGSSFVFMDNKTFEEYYISEEQVGGKVKFLMEGNNYELSFLDDENRILDLILPIFINLKVTETEPGVKGDTATQTLKPATLETGLKVNVPIFIKLDELLKIDTRTGEYVERA